MISLTLEYAGVEKLLVDWGYADPQLRLVSQAVSMFTCRCPVELPESNSEDIPNWGVVKIRMGRVGSGTSFSGGSVIFAGRRTDYGRLADPQNPGTLRQFSDPWYDLTQTCFQHYWKVWNGSALVDFYFSRLNLFQDISAGPGVAWTYLTTQAQIQQIIAFAALCGCNLQAGVIDPTWNVPAYAVKGITCAEALQMCVRPMADVVTYFDYTTTPPTLHVRQRGELGAVTLPFAGTDAQGRSHASSKIKSRGDLIPRCVSIQYMKTSTVDDKTYTVPTTDTFPVGRNPAAMGALVVPIDLRGSVTHNTKQAITNVAVDPTTTAFWSDRKPDLDVSKAGCLVANLAVVDNTLNGDPAAHPDGVTILDRTTKAPVSLGDFPNEIRKGQVASWMRDNFGNPINARKVIITATLAYTKLNPRTNTDTDHIIEKHVVTYECTLTNSPVGDQNYSALKSYTAGDPDVLDLAQNTYESLSQLQWEGDHVIVEDDLYEIVSPAKNLNLAGGAAAWTNMNAAVVDVSVDFTRGTTTVSFGAHKHLSAPQFLEYLMMWRLRQVYDNPSLRNDGQTSNSNDVTLPENQGAANTAESLPSQPLFSLPVAQPNVSIGGVSTSQPDAKVQLDAHLLLPSTVFSGGLGDNLAPADRKVVLQKVQMCVNGVKQFAIVPITKTFSA